MPSGNNNMDKNLDDEFLIMQATMDYNMQVYDEKMKTYDYKLENLTEMIEKMMVQN